MKFKNKSEATIVLLGAGGSGGYIAPHLYRIAYAAEKSVRIIIVDGDVVEEKNLIRQNFVEYDIGRNKARVLAERYAGAFGVETEYIPRFIEDVNDLKRTIYKSTSWYNNNNLFILIGAVDNNRSRQMCHELFNSVNDLIYIDSGNGEYTGQVVCGVKRNGHNLMKPVASWYPDILKSEDKFPTELSCAERSVSAPQTITANLFASTIVSSILYHLLICDRLPARKTTFSSKTFNCKSVLSKRG